MQPHAEKKNELAGGRFHNTVRSKVNAVKLKTDKLMLERTKKFQALYSANNALGEHFAQFFFLS